jgi:lipoprotein-anchoring transpeptidase ErfK/SrfK
MKSDEMKQKKDKATNGKHAQNNVSNQKNQETQDAQNTVPRSNPEESSTPKVAKPLNSQGPSGFVSATDTLGATSKKKMSKKTRRTIRNTLLAFFGFVVLVYAAGLIFFMTHFYPNTLIGDYDISIKSQTEAADILADSVGDYQLKVTGQGLSFTLLAADMEIVQDSNAVIQDALATTRPWAWPALIFQTHDVSGSLKPSYDETKLTEIVTGQVATFNEGATYPTNATIVLNESTNKFEIKTEQYGTALDSAAVLAAIDSAISSLEQQVAITSGEEILPTVTKENDALALAVVSANKIASSKITLTLDAVALTEVNVTVIAPWIILTENLEVTLSDEAFDSWFDGVVSSTNTVGNERTYTRADGKVITVSGGTYGWEVDSESLRATVKEAVLSGTTQTIAVPVSQAGNGHSGVGGRDWGNRYVDIDLTEQHARFYDASGTLIWESDIVSGSSGSRATPTGVYVINKLQSPSVLIGTPLPGETEPAYRTSVTYWMPFVGNSVGLHDATWQSSFGGTRYLDGYGSHGCVNLPYAAAQEIYGLLEVGDVVVSHY